MKKILTGMALLFAAHVSAAPLIKIDPAQQKALGITTTTVEPVSEAWGSAYPAKVRVPNAQLMVVSAPQEGLLTTLRVAEGETVRKGQALATIQSPKLVEEQRLYLEAVTRLALARAELARDKQLKAEGIIAERRQALQLAGMDEEAIRQLENKHTLSPVLQVRSPMDGVVLAQLATPGQRIDIASPIYRIGRLDPLWLEIRVPLEKLGDITIGTAVRVDETAATGRIITVGSMIHDEDQSVLVRAEIANPDGKLRPGQFVQAQLALNTNGNAWRVPRQALLRVAGKQWVMVKEGAAFRPVAVTISAEESTSLIIRGPLQDGDQVATSGTAALKSAWQVE